MEEIIGLLIVVATFIFKVVGKKLENSAQPQKPIQDPVQQPFQKPVQELDSEGGFVSSATFGFPEPVFEMREVVTRQVLPQEQEPQPDAVPQRETPQPKLKTQQKPKSTPKKPILKEVVPKDKEKIDLKKMIVYSEIMSPKYKNNNF